MPSDDGFGVGGWFSFRYIPSGKLTVRRLEYHHVQQGPYYIHRLISGPPFSSNRYICFFVGKKNEKLTKGTQQIGCFVNVPRGPFSGSFRGQVTRGCFWQNFPVNRVWLKLSVSIVDWNPKLVHEVSKSPEIFCFKWPILIFLERVHTENLMFPSICQWMVGTLNEWGEPLIFTWELAGIQKNAIHFIHWLAKTASR